MTFNITASQTDSLVEHFNETFKMIMRKFVTSEGEACDCLLPYSVVCIYRSSQKTTGFIIV